VNQRNSWLAVLALVLAAGCASGPEESIVAKNDAIDDYIKVSGIEAVDAIRKRGDLHHEVLTDRYIILRDRQNAYLATFARRCYELDDNRITPDIRYDSNTVRARFDTYRGCLIESLFKLSDGELMELEALAAKE